MNAPISTNATTPDTLAHLAAVQTLQAQPDQDAAETTRGSTETNPPSPTKPTTAPKLAMTRILSTKPAILTKSFFLKDNKIEKTSIAQMTRGAAELVEVVGLSGLRDLLDGLPRNAALVYGVAAAHPQAEIVRDPDLPKHPGAISRTRRFFGFRRAPGVWMLDYDPQGDETPVAPADLLATFRGLAPCLAAVPILWRASASSGIARAGEAGPLKGQRLYVPVSDAARIPEAGKALTALLWAAGHGRIIIGKAGQALERSVFDAAVWQPERLDFAAAPAVGQGLNRTVAPSFIDGDADGPCLDLRDLIAAADGTIRQHADAARKAARAAAKPQLDEARESWVEATAAGLVQEEDEEKREKVRATLRRAVVKRELTGDFPLLAADGSTPTVGDLLDNPARWHGKRFADPLEPDYDTDPRIAWANLRSGGKPYIHSHAHGGRRYTLIRPSARIRLAKGDRARVVDQLLDALRERGELYDMGEGATLSRVTSDARALPVSRDWLTDHLDRVFSFYVVVAKPDGTTGEDTTDAPAWAAMRIAAKDGERRFHRLDAVVTAPTLRTDGSILSEPGYDAVARLLLVSDAPALPHIPLEPTTAQAAEALRVLWWPFQLFPLVDEVDRAVVLAALLTACLRASLPTAPGFGFDAPTAGTGKTLLAQAVGALSLGSTPAALPPASNVDEEARKRLFAALRDGHRVILWDNVRDAMGNAAMDAFLTAPTFQDRILGVSQTATLPNRALFLTTGNNLRLVGDTCRRILTARLDAKLERPYAREFDFCPLALVLAHRLELVAAALTLVRAWIAHGRPRLGEGRTASFETWDDLVRQPVCWVASWDARYADPLEATARAFSLDPETAKLAALLSAWSATFGDHPTTTAELVAATEDPAGTFQERSGAKPEPDAHRAALADAVEEIAGDRGKINRRMLGRWIERHAERRHNGQRLVRGKLRRGAPTWILVQDRAKVSG